jgi:hypothetical protein
LFAQELAVKRTLQEARTELQAGGFSAVVAFGFPSVAQHNPSTTHPDKATIHVTSTPSDGEVYIDGKFYGNTPSTLLLPTGQHMVRISLHGKDWSRSVEINGGEINIHADFAEENDSSSSSGTETAKESGSPWGASQPAVEALRAVAQDVKRCPQNYLILTELRPQKGSGEPPKLLSGPAQNVTWDVTRSDSVRAPYLGFLEFTMAWELWIPPGFETDIRKNPGFAIWSNFDRDEGYKPDEYRYEFDVGPDGLELSRALTRKQGQTEWKPNSTSSP